jgi:hypothetical protein
MIEVGDFEMDVAYAGFGRDGHVGLDVHARLMGSSCHVVGVSRGKRFARSANIHSFAKNAKDGDPVQLVKLNQ